MLNIKFYEKRSGSVTKEISRRAIYGGFKLNKIWGPRPGSALKKHIEREETERIPVHPLWRRSREEVSGERVVSVLMFL